MKLILYKFFNIKIFFIFFCISFSMLCGGKQVPIELLSLAKSQIMFAEGVLADQYANKEIEQAREKLLSAHEFVTKQKMDVASLKAKEAYELALQAYNISLPKLVSDKRALAEDAYNKALLAYAEEFAKDEFAQSTSSLSLGIENQKKKDYTTAITDFNTAKNHADKAIELSQGRLGDIQEDIIEIEELIRRAYDFGAEDFAKQEIALALTSIQDAKNFLNESFIKQACLSKNIARENAQNAYDLSVKAYATKIHGQANEKVTSLSTLIDRLTVRVDTKLIPYNKNDDVVNLLQSISSVMNAMRDSFALASSTLAENNYLVSISHSEEVLRLAVIVNEQLIAFIEFVDAQYRIKISLEEEIQAEPEVVVPEVVIAPVIEKPVEVKLAPVVKKAVKPQSRFTTYRVKLSNPRECLWRISGYKSIYGNGRKWPSIYKANKHKIKNPNLIHPGLLLQIPRELKKNTK